MVRLQVCLQVCFHYFQGKMWWILVRMCADPCLSLGFVCVSLRLRIANGFTFVFIYTVGNTASGDVFLLLFASSCREDTTIGIYHWR